MGLIASALALWWWELARESEDPVPLVDAYLVASILAGIVLVAVVRWPGQWLAGACVAVAHGTIVVFLLLAEEMFVPAVLPVIPHFLAALLIGAWVADNRLTRRRFAHEK